MRCGQVVELKLWAQREAGLKLGVIPGWIRGWTGLVWGGDCGEYFCLKAMGSNRMAVIRFWIRSQMIQTLGLSLHLIAIRS